MARKKKKYSAINPDEIRNKMVGVKLTPDEFIKVNAICENVGVTKSRFFRYLFTEYIKNEKL